MQDRRPHERSDMRAIMPRGMVPGFRDAHPGYAEPTARERAMSPSPEHLESYLSGRWVRGEGVETRLVDPVKGDELATVSAKGVDLGAALDHARSLGQGALRATS